MLKFKLCCKVFQEFTALVLKAVDKQQDLAPAHTAKKNKSWLSNGDTTVNLNPIENL